jgi:hypothetical protein
LCSQSFVLFLVFYGLEIAEDNETPVEEDNESPRIQEIDKDSSPPIINDVDSDEEKKISQILE